MAILLIEDPEDYLADYPPKQWEESNDSITIPWQARKPRKYPSSYLDNVEKNNPAYRIAQLLITAEGTTPNSHQHAKPHDNPRPN